VPNATTIEQLINTNNPHPVQREAAEALVAPLREAGVTLPSRYAAEAILRLLREHRDSYGVEAITDFASLVKAAEEAGADFFVHGSPRLHTQEYNDWLVTHAQSLQRRAYYSHVKACAQDLIDRLKSGEIEDYDAFDTALHEEVDGDRWVFVTHRAQLVGVISDNAGCALEEFGAEGVVENGSIKWSYIAFFAMQADLVEALSQLGFEDFSDEGVEELREETDDDEDDD
jgi:hypothetical protein